MTEPTNWVSSLVYAQKPSGKWRICLDPKDLNQAIKRSQHHTPTLDEITHKFSGSTIFSKLDARHGYWSVLLDEESSYLTTFNSPFGRYRFLRLPFGLCVSQDVFQHRMDQILEKCPGTVGIADDVGVYGTTEDEHDKHLHNLMSVARTHGLVFNPTKCEIKKDSITFFGLRYTKDGVQPDPDKIKAIQVIKAPQNKKQLQEFLGIATYMAPFVPNLSSHTAILRELIKKDVLFEWTASHQKVFNLVKDLICKATTLAYFDPGKETVLQVDASLSGLGATLLQEGKPISFVSKALTDTEKRYANIEREMLAVVFACERYRTYVYGKPFTVHSDHKPLEMIHLKNLCAAPPRLQRMLLRLQGYDVTIRYKPGREMLLADAMSRLNPIANDEREQTPMKVEFVHFSENKLNSIKDATKDDEELTALKNIIINGWPERQRDTPQPIRKYWAYRDELSIEDGLIIKGDRIVIPRTLQEDILSKIHEAHQGVTKCQLRAKACVFWHNINRDIEGLVKACSLCQEYSRSLPREPLQPQEIPTGPWQTIGSDLFTLHGEDYLIVVDYYSKFPIIRRIPKGNSTSQTIITYLKQIFSEHGIPSKFISDNGSQYSSQLFKSFAHSWGFQHVTSSPIFPQSNGMAERYVQTVKNTVAKAMKDKRDVYLALLCIRTTPVDNQLPSPAELLFNRKIRSNLPTQIQNNNPDKDKIADRLQSRQSNQKAHFDTRTKPQPPLITGQNVYIQDQTGKKRWHPAVVNKVRDEPRSYDVTTQQGTTLRRNRRHLKEAAGKHVQFSLEPEIIINNNPTPVHQTTSNIPNIHENKRYTYKQLTQTKQTRSGRNVIPRNTLDL